MQERLFKFFVFLFISFTLSTAEKAQNDIFLVTPLYGQYCQNRAPCHTLEDYNQQNSSIFSTSNVTWIFLEGNYTVSFVLEIFGAENIIFKGEREGCCELIFTSGASILEAKNILFKNLKIRSIMRKQSEIPLDVFVSVIPIANWINLPQFNISNVENLTLNKVLMVDWNFIITEPFGVCDFLNCTFQNVNYLLNGDSQKLRITLVNCEFHDSLFVFKGTAISGHEFINSSVYLGLSEPKVILINCTFHSKENGFFIIANSESPVILSNCTFKNNTEFGILFKRSVIFLQNNIIISNNSNSLSYQDLLRIMHSTVLLQNNSDVRIFNNRGGGIYGCFPPDLYSDLWNGLCTRRQSSQHRHFCFFQFVQQDGQWLQLGDFQNFKALIALKNNTKANVYQGKNIFAGHISNCIIQTQDGGIHTNQTFLQHFIKLPSWKSKDISSPTNQICFCHEDNLSNRDLWDCGNETNFALYSGEELKLHITLLGDFNQTVINNYLEIRNEGDFDSILLNKECQQYSFSLYKHNSSQVHHFTLTPRTDFKEISCVSRNLYITIRQHCPPGFVQKWSDSKIDSHSTTISNENGWCSCSPTLTTFNVTCSLYQGVPKFLSKNIWIGLKEEALVICDYCPSFHCNVQDKISGITLENIQLENFTRQCNIGNMRQGFLCSECPDGYSSTLGGFKCRKCQSFWLLFLIIYALAGLAFLAFLFLFNFTIVQGTINGIILYVNIMYLYNDFLQQYASSSVYAVFSIFHFGTGKNVCFYDGMEEISKSLLRFTFPTYLVILALLIIFGAQFLKLKLFRVQFIIKRCVPVLATVMILTYTNLVEAIWHSFRYNRVYYISKDGGLSKDLVWLYQPKLHYFQGKHLALGLLAIVVSIIYIFPLTIVVLFGEPLRRRIIRKTWFSHIIDVFQGAYRKPFGFWLGLRLVFRIILVPMQNYSIHLSKINFAHTVLSCLILFLCLENLVKPFLRKIKINDETKKKNPTWKNGIISFMNWLIHPQVQDNLYLLNLIFLSIVLAGKPNNFEYYQIALNLSMVIAFVQVFYIIGCHGYLYFPIPKYLKLKMKQLKENLKKWRSKEGIQNIEDNSAEFFPFRDVHYSSDSEPISAQQS